MTANACKTVLILDDDVALLDGFRRRIGAHYDLRPFTEPIEALEAVRRDGPFPVVVSDMRMPQMDGITFLRQVRRLCPESVGIILTGADEQELAVQAVNDGHIFRFLKKPCSKEDVLQAYDAALVEYRRRSDRNGFQYRLTQADRNQTEIEPGAGVRAVTGYAGSDFVDRAGQWDALTLPPDKSVVETFYARVWAGQPVDPVEYRIRRKDGTVIWVRNTLLACRSDGRVCEGQLQDITEQKHIEENLEQARRRYEKIVANVPGLVFQCKLQSDGAFEFTFVSHSCLRFLGLTVEQICADSGLFFKAFRAEDRSRFFSILTESAERLSPLVWQGCYTLGSTERWFQGSAQPERMADGCVLWDGLMVEITEQKHSERYAEFLAQFPKEDPNPVLRVNEDGRIIYANNASFPLLHIWERQVGQLLPQELYDIVAAVHRNGKPITYEQRCRDHHYAIVCAPVQGTADVNLYARDITKIKIAELELRTANQILLEHDRLKSEFVSTVTHELRTPLCIFRNILSNALAGVHGSISRRLRENLEMAQEGVERLSRIISDFLDMSKIEAGSLRLDPQRCSLDELIVQTCRSLKLLAAAKKIKIQTVLPNKSCPAWVDRDRIEQVLVNLIGNAIKFISIRGHIIVRLEQTDEQFVVSVEDDGPGLSCEEMARVFDRFVQTKNLKGPGEHGTGLGLAISRELVHLHGGTIRVDSEVGKGCVFSFTIPRQIEVASVLSEDPLYVH